MDHREKKELEYLLGRALASTQTTYNSKEGVYYYGLLPPLELFLLWLVIILTNNANSNDIEGCSMSFFSLFTLVSIDNRHCEADIHGGMLLGCVPLQTYLHYLGFQVNKFKKPFGQRYIVFNDIDLSFQ